MPRNIFVTDSDVKTVELPQGGTAVIKTSMPMGEFIDTFINTTSTTTLTKEQILGILVKTVVSLTNVDGVTYDKPNEDLLARLHPDIGMFLFKAVETGFGETVAQDPFEKPSSSL